VFLAKQTRLDAYQILPSPTSALTAMGVMIYQRQLLIWFDRRLSMLMLLKSE
jgi:hypothetical protein